jgi:signal transduction histidine kinase
MKHRGQGNLFPAYYNVRVLEQPDPGWPRLLSLSVHEFRTPITVVAGYIRMLLKDRAGPVSDQQRRLLEEAEKSCARLSGLVAEMSDLAILEAGTGTFNRTVLDLHDLLNETIASLPVVPDRDVRVELSTNGSEAAIEGDAARLKSAFTSLLTALRRELVTSDTLFVHQGSRQQDGRAVSWIAFGDSEHITRLADADPSSLQTFDEWRGGCGLSLAIARRVIGAHHGRMWSGGEESRAAAVVMLPHRF